MLLSLGTIRVCCNRDKLGPRRRSSGRSESSYMSSIRTHRSNSTSSTGVGCYNNGAYSYWTDFAPQHPAFQYLHPTHDQYRRAWDMLALETTRRKSMMFHVGDSVPVSSENNGKSNRKSRRKETEDIKEKE